VGLLLTGALGSSRFACFPSSFTDRPRQMSRICRDISAVKKPPPGSSREGKETSLPDHYHLADAPVKTDTMSVLAETKFTNLMLSARCAALVCPCRLNGRPFLIACLLLEAIVARAHDAPGGRPANVREMFRVS
jgi:hypothetical protein